MTISISYEFYTSNWKLPFTRTIAGTVTLKVRSTTKTIVTCTLSLLKIRHDKYYITFIFYIYTISKTSILSKSSKNTAVKEPPSQNKAINTVQHVQKRPKNPTMHHRQHFHTHSLVVAVAPKDIIFILAYSEPHLPMVPIPIQIPLRQPEIRLPVRVGRG